MKANELRIGNFVDLYGKVATITRSDFSETEYGIAIESGKPIPLTQEWLERFGFENHHDTILGVKEVGAWTNNQIIWLHHINDNYYQLSIGRNRKHGLTTVFVEHAHQLQNLYFALCGVELEIKN